MPSRQAKRLFVGGLDRDSDPRLVKNGDYHHALNIRNISSEGSTEGLIENIKGTKEMPYIFPEAVDDSRKTNKIVLFMPTGRFWNNYGNIPIDDSISASDNLNYNPDFPIDFDGQPNSTLLEYSAFGGGLGLFTFDIAYGSSMGEMLGSPILFEMAYNGDTLAHMKNYLDFWVSYHGPQLSNLGVTATVINNNHYDFDESYFFGDDNVQSIVNHPNYSSGQIHAYALLFESVEDFYVDILPKGPTYSSPSLFENYVDSITGTLFTFPTASIIPLTQVFVGDSSMYTSTPWEGDETNVWYTQAGADTEISGWAIGEDAHFFIHPQAVRYPKPDAVGDDDSDDDEEVEIEYSTIGAYEDTENDKIFWMVASDASFHLILEYDIKLDLVRTVFKDSGNPATSVFNWRKEFLINDINRVGDVLYWTSRQYGEPCSINVEKCRISNTKASLGSYIVDEAGGTDGSLEEYYPYSLFDPAYPKEKKREYFEVIKRPPMYAPTYVYDDDENYSKNNLFGHMWQFRYRYHYYDNEVSAWSPISDVVPSKFDVNNISQPSITPGDANKIIISVKNSSGIVKSIEIAGRRCKDLGSLSRGNRGPYFTVAKIDNDFGAWKANENSEQTIDFYNDQMYPQVLAGEGERLFDAVPRSAHTQTVLGNNRLAYANYTEGFDLPEISRSSTVSPQYGYTQAGGVYGGVNYVDPITGVTGAGVSSFKSGAYHSFGIVYYDEKGRCSTVLVDDNTRCYVKFPTERTAEDVVTGNPTEQYLGAVTMQWSISHRAPDWAKYYRWAYSRNNSVDEFIQFRLLHAFNNNDPASSDNRIFLSLRGLKGSVDSYIGVGELDQQAVPEPDVNILDYEFIKGDRLRIITSGTQTTENFPDEETVITNYYDIKVSGFEYYSYLNPNIPIRDANGLNALLNDGSQDGWYLIVNEILDVDGNVVTDYGASDVEANSDLFEQAIVEIYRPKQDPEPGEMFYYEFSELYDIDTVTGAHLGPLADQGTDWSSLSLGTQTSTNPAKGEFTTGDVYYKNRDMNTFDSISASGSNTHGKGTQGFYIEDYFLNDFLETNHFSIGRANIYSAFYREQHKESSVTYSDVYQPASSFNGLSTFDYNEGNWKDYSRIFGTIQKIHYRDTDLVMIHEDRTFSAPINKDIILSADGKGTLGISDKILGPEKAYTHHYGISKNPESFVSDGNVLYWTDIRRGAVVRLSRDGITPISSVKMLDFFRDRADRYIEYDPQNGWPNSYGEISGPVLSGDHMKFRIKGGFNPKHGEYVVQFSNIARPSAEWENFATIYDDTNSEWNILTDEQIDDLKSPLVVGGTVCWTEKQKRWTSLYSHIAEYYCKINKLFVSWDGGILWKHDQDPDNYNTFYGVNYNTELDFYINDKPSTVKGFKTITLEANQEFELVTELQENEETGEEEEVEVEETEKTAYDIDLVTDMTETFIDRHNFDERENKQYVQIPFVTENSKGSEIIGLGSATIDGDEYVQGMFNWQIVGGENVNYYIPNLILGASSDESSVDYGDQIYYNNGEEDIFIGTAAAILDTNIIGAVGSADQTVFEDEMVIDNQEIFVKRSGYAEGDRMKGRFMEVKMKKKSKRLLEIFSASSTIFDSELSDD